MKKLQKPWYSGCNCLYSTASLKVNHWTLNNEFNIFVYKDVGAILNLSAILLLSSFIFNRIIKILCLCGVFTYRRHMSPAGHKVCFLAILTRNLSVFPGRTCNDTYSFYIYSTGMLLSSRFPTKNAVMSCFFSSILMQFDGPWIYSMILKVVSALLSYKRQPRKCHYNSILFKDTSH